MRGHYFSIIFLLLGFGLNEIYCQNKELSGKCRAPDKAPTNLELIINVCQEEIKAALLQEALDILNDDALEQNKPNENRSKREVDEDLTNEERRVAGCLLQCVYKKVKAVDETGFPVADGLMKLYNEGVQDRNYYIATLTAVRHCISIAEQLKQQQPSQKFDDGQTCDLAYEMFECVSEKIDENCGVEDKSNSVAQRYV
ncbi:Pheromone/general odorant binding protein [Cinara cedri]|uniref:Pheromone/general odorant binding protein n=1 Tax=Cinara cedri TaxID=506608 RepID=A0A5E4N686_9HEMI|nr:Pheromone/general odorant binding protein [Cinara cedri]